jgi:hypothetical protein
MSYVSGEIKNNILSGKPFQDTVKKKSPNGFGFQNYILNEKKKVPKRIRPRHIPCSRAFPSPGHRSTEFRLNAFKRYFICKSGPYYLYVKNNFN